MGDHPISWCHEYDGGRAFYTALGHKGVYWKEPLLLVARARRDPDGRRRGEVQLPGGRLSPRAAA